MDRRIHSVELLELALATARRLGYRVREDALGGFAGGGCQIKGQKWLLLDPNLSTRERLQVVLDVLAADGDLAAIDLSPPLAAALQCTRAA